MNRLLNIALIAMMSMLLHGYSMMAQTIVKVKIPGTLATSLTSAQRDTCTWLVVKGKLNTSDVLTLRRMAGADGGNGVLRCLDLSNARFVRDHHPYLVLDVDSTEMEVHLSIIGHTHMRINYEGLAAATSIHAPANGLSYEEMWLGKDKYKDVRSNMYMISSIRMVSGRENVARHVGENGLRCYVYGMATDFNFLCKTNVASGEDYSFAKQNGQKLFKAYLNKHSISDAMFHGATSLRVVVLPKEIQYDPTVKIQDHNVCFYRPK